MTSPRSGDIRPEVKIEHFDLERMADIPAAMVRIGGLCGNPVAGRHAANNFIAALNALACRTASLPHPRVLFVIGYDSPAPAGATASFTT